MGNAEKRPAADLLSRAHRLVAVFGGGVAGLSAAIHARLAGSDVTVYEPRAVGGKAAAIETQGYRLDPGPSILILPHLYEAVFVRAGRRMEDYLTLDRLDPITRVFWRGETIDIPAGLDGATEVVRSLDAHDAESFADLMGRLARIAPLVERSIFAAPIDRWWQLGSPDLIRTALPLWPGKPYRKAIDDLFRHPLLRAFFYGFPSYSGQSYRSASVGGFLIPYYMFANGVFYPRGGVAAIPAAFERLARELGVRFEAERVVRFHRKRDRITGARLDNGEEVVADAYIVAFDRFTAAAMLGEPETRAPSYSYFTVHYGLKERVERLSHHSLIVPEGFEAGFERLYDRREFPEPAIVYLNDTTATDPGVAPTGRTNLFAVVTVPAREEHLDWAKLEVSGKAAVEAALKSIGVDVEAIGTDFVRVQSPRYFEEAHGNYRGTLYGVDEAHRLFRGILPHGNRDARYRNLAYCGGAVQPGAGLPMATLSGRFAVEALG